MTQITPAYSLSRGSNDNWTRDDWVHKRSTMLYHARHTRWSIISTKLSWAAHAAWRASIDLIATETGDRVGQAMIVKKRLRYWAQKIGKLYPHKPKYRDAVIRMAHEIIRCHPAGIQAAVLLRAMTKSCG